MDDNIPVVGSLTANEIEYKEPLELILLELQKMNTYLSLVTDDVIEEEDVLQ